MIGQWTDSTFSYVTITGVIRPFRSQSLDSPDVHLKTQLEITSHTQKCIQNTFWRSISAGSVRARFFGRILIKYLPHFSPLNVLKGPSWTSDANPKSINLIASLRMSNKMFSGLRSRWRTPFSSQLMLASMIWAKYLRASFSVRNTFICRTSNKSLQISGLSIT